MKIAYLDESGSPDRSGQTSHFVLLAAAIDASDWKSKDQAIAKLKHEYGLGDAEVHAGWMARRYVECS